MRLNGRLTGSIQVMWRRGSTRRIWSTSVNAVGVVLFNERRPHQSDTWSIKRWTIVSRGGVLVPQTSSLQSFYATTSTAHFDCALVALLDKQCWTLPNAITNAARTVQPFVLLILNVKTMGNDRRTRFSPTITACHTDSHTTYTKFAFMHPFNHRTLWFFKLIADYTGYEAH